MDKHENTNSVIEATLNAPGMGAGKRGEARRAAAAAVIQATGGCQMTSIGGPGRIVSACDCHAPELALEMEMPHSYAMCSGGVLLAGRTHSSFGGVRHTNKTPPQLAFIVQELPAELALTPRLTLVCLFALTAVAATALSAIRA